MTHCHEWTDRSRHTSLIPIDCPGSTKPAPGARNTCRPARPSPFSAPILGCSSSLLGCHWTRMANRMFRVVCQPGPRSSPRRPIPSSHAIGPSEAGVSIRRLSSSRFCWASPARTRRRAPSKPYLALSEIDRARAGEKPLSDQTTLLLARHFAKYGDQYPTFAEFHALIDTSIVEFINTAEVISRLQDATLRAEVTGTLQAQSGLWQILARQGQIPKADFNGSWQRLIHPFAGIHSFLRLYDATGSSSCRADALRNRKHSYISG